MKVYRIFLKKDGENKIEDLKILKEGFDFNSLLFGCFYFYLRRLWWQEGVILIILLLSIFMPSLFFIFFPLLFVILVYFGFKSVNWYSKKLLDLGYVYLGYSIGNNIKEAKLKFLETLNNDYSDNDKLQKLIYE